MEITSLKRNIDQADIGKLTTFNITRLGIFIVILISTIFLRQEVLGVGTISQVYGILFLSFLISLLNVVFWKETRKSKNLMIYQLLYDLLFTSYLVSLTGVNDSIFLFLYLINIVVSAILFQLHGSLFVAGISGAIYAVLYYISVGFDQSILVYNLAYSELLFLLTALLSGQFMDQLKQQRELLTAQNRNILRLETLNNQLLNNIPLGLISVDSKESIQTINHTALELLHMDRTPEFQIRYYELLPELKGILAAWPKMTDRQKLKFQFRDSKNKKALFALQVVSYTNADIEVDSNDQIHLIIFQDVSKVEELEEKLALETRLSAVGQLAAGIAHEIRNPLASISGSIETLGENLKPENSEDQKLINISLREIRRLNTLITEFLEFAKPKEFRRIEFNLLDLLHEVAETMKSGLKKEIELVFSISVSPDISVDSDRERLKRVFFNLFNNSIEARKSSPVNLTIQSFFDPSGDLNLQLKDNGTGITDEIRSKIFDPFFTTKSNGTGLGLPTVAKIVQQLRGEISSLPCESGALFQIKLPAQTIKKNKANAVPI